MQFMFPCLSSSRVGTETLLHLLLCEMMVKKSVRLTGDPCKQATDATDVVQDQVDQLNSRGRRAARIRRSNSAASQW
jgi:hypothetical protein